MGAIGQLIEAIATLLTSVLHLLYEIIGWPFRKLAVVLTYVAKKITEVAERLSGGKDPSPIARFLGWTITLFLVFWLLAVACRAIANSQLSRKIFNLSNSVLQELQLATIESPYKEIEVTEDSPQTTESSSLTTTLEARGTQSFYQAPFDHALDLDGVDDYVSLPAFNLNTNTVTIEAWIKPDGSQNAWAGIVSSRAASTTAGLLILTDNEVRYIWNGDHYNWSSEAYAPPDVWSHVALVIEPTKATIYLNGVAHINNTNHLPESFDGEMLIGHDFGYSNRYFDGAFDDVQIWNTARLQEQIISDMHMQLVDSKPGLIAYYSFDQGTPGSNNSDVITAHDVTGNHNGVLVNFALVGSGSNWIVSDTIE